MRGSLVINYDYEYNMELKDSMGSTNTKIYFLSADKPNPGLGSTMCPDDNQLYDFEVRVKRVNKNARLQ